MKSNQKFQIDQAWWRKNKAKTLKSTGLGAAMKDFKDALDACEARAKVGSYKGSDDKLPFDDADLAYKALCTAVEKAKGMCNKKLHAETLSCLNTAPSVLKEAKQAIANAKQKFETDYAKVLGPKLKQAQESEKLCKTLDAKSKQGMSDAKVQTRTVEALLKGLESWTRSKILDHLDDANAAVKRLDSLYKEQVEFGKQADQAVKVIDRGTNLLGPDDKSVQVGHLNASNKLKNDIWMRRDKMQLLLATARGDLEDIKSKEKNLRTSEQSHLKTLAKVVDALKSLGETARRQNNTMVPWETDLREMRKAQRIAKEDGTTPTSSAVTHRPEKWKEAAADYVKQSKVIAAKAEKMKGQAIALKEKSLEKIDQAVLKQKEFAELVIRMDSYIKEISDYSLKNASSVVNIEKSAKLVE